MTHLLKFTFFISLLFAVNIAKAQQKTEQKPAQEIDTLKVKQVYGIRFGVDISKPIISTINHNFKGFEAVADVRFRNNLYAALELGYDTKTSTEDFLNYTSKGSYAKIGVNFNAYKNWLDMTNEIYVGFRYGISFFEQTLNSYTPNVYGTYFVPELIEKSTNFTGLNAHWTEFLLGIKAETFNNFYMGFSVRFNILLSEKEPENFKNLVIPGFNKVSLNNLGFSFNYTLSYLIPYAKK